MGQQISCRLTRRYILLLLFSLVIIPIKLPVVLANDDLFESRQHRERNIKQGSMGMDGITRDRLRDTIDRYCNPNMDDRSVKYDPTRRQRLLSKTQGDHKASMYDTSDNSSSTTWITEAVGAQRGFSNFSSRAIAIDSNNNPHIAYGGKNLYYAHYNGSNWVYETVDSSPGVGEYASIAMDTAGKAHISYLNYTTNGYTAVIGNLKYAMNATQTPTTTPTISPTPSPSPVVTPTPTASPSPTPTVEATPTPTPSPSGCDGEVKTVETNTGDFKLLKLEREVVVVAVTDAGGCPVANEKVTAKVNVAGKKCIKINSSGETTNENGEATFTITAKKKTGNAKVTFKAGGIKEKITVNVVSE